MQSVMIGEILIGFGIVTQLLGWLVSNWSNWNVYVGFILSLAAGGLYVWGVLKYNDYVQQQTDKIAFRAWRINFIQFWVAAGVTLINMLLSFAYVGKSSCPSTTTPATTAVAAATAAAVNAAAAAAAVNAVSTTC